MLWCYDTVVLSHVAQKAYLILFDTTSTVVYMDTFFITGIERTWNTNTFQWLQKGKPRLLVVIQKQRLKYVY